MEFRKRKRLPEKTTIENLPVDMLHQIFVRLNDSDLKSTMLVCRQFHSISTYHVRNLTVISSYLTYEEFCKLLMRFPSVKKIHIKLKGFLDDALLAISDSALNLETLQLMSPHNPAQQTLLNMSKSRVIQSIKTLRMNWFYDDYINRGNIVEQHASSTQFINLFPSLSKLKLNFKYCSRGFTDTEAIAKITGKLPNLKKIAINDNMSFRIGDKILAALNSNCPRLESVDLRGWSFSLGALHTYLCNNPQLRSIDMPATYSRPGPNITDWVHMVKDFNHLSLTGPFVDDAILIALAKSQPSLKSLHLGKCYLGHYTMGGLAQLLFSCSGLERLTVHLPHCRDREEGDSQDDAMIRIVRQLPCLKYIKVVSHIVSQGTLFSLVDNCPLLEEICIKKNNVGEKRQQIYYPASLIIRPTKVNYSIETIKISPEEWDICLRHTIEAYCPSLRK